MTEFDRRGATEARRAIEAVFRIESPRLIASLARLVRDVGLAEDLAQDALVAALEQWPESGIPQNPAAWLMTTARRRAIDQTAAPVELRTQGGRGRARHRGPIREPRPRCRHR